MANDEHAVPLSVAEIEQIRERAQEPDAGQLAQ
jgi:hypothetical protein